LSKDLNHLGKRRLQLKAKKRSGPKAALVVMSNGKILLRLLSDRVERKSFLYVAH
jgi:hypothetical protein